MDARAFLVQRATGGGEAARYSLAGQTTTIGRWDGSDVAIDDQEISRRHAQIRHEGGKFVLADLGSKNGTRINGLPVERATALKDGDEITIGTQHRFLFVDQDATVQATGRHKGIRVDATSREVNVNGEKVDPPLAPNQFALVELLAGQPGRVFSRDEIADACYPDSDDGVSDQAIDGVVRRTRARLAEVDPDNELIVAIRGHGFRLDPPR